MPRDLLIGNGSLVVAFDSQYRLADIYFPHVGQENHAGAPSRFGVWADGVISWVESDAWQRTLTYLRETLVTDVTCTSEALGLRLRCYDVVDADANLYVRKIVVRNLRETARTIKLFFHHDFNLYGNASSDTAYFDPDSRSIIHYKAKRYFLINTASESGAGIAEYACGRSGIGNEGTWRDAEDGQLSMNAIQQGAVDSVIGISLNLEPHGSDTAFYWICAGMRYGDAEVLRGVTLDFRASELAAIAGPNGAGKSTLLGIMAGLRHGYAGACRYRGVEVRRWQRRASIPWHGPSRGEQFPQKSLTRPAIAVICCAPCRAPRRTSPRSSRERAASRAPPRASGFCRRARCRGGCGHRPSGFSTSPP